MRVKDAASQAGVAEKTFRMHVLRGKVRTTKVGSRVDISDDDLNVYMLIEDMRNALSAAEGQPGPAARDHIRRVIHRYGV